MFLFLLRMFFILNSTREGLVLFRMFELNKKKCKLRSGDDKTENAIPNLKEINDKCSKHNWHC